MRVFVCFFLCVRVSMERRAEGIMKRRRMNGMTLEILVAFSFFRGFGLLSLLFLPHLMIPITHGFVIVVVAACYYALCLVAR